MVSSLYGDSLFKERDFSINVFNQFSMSQDYWLIEGYESERSIKYSRNRLELYSVSGDLLRVIYLQNNYSGYIVSDASPDAKNYNKRQGIALGDGFLLLVMVLFTTPKWKVLIIHIKALEFLIFPESFYLKKFSLQMK